MPLAQAVTAVAVERASGRTGQAAAAVMQGVRNHFEDSHHLDPDAGIFAVFDGHLGDDAATFCAERAHLHLAVQMEANSGVLNRDVLLATFAACDDDLREALPADSSSGCTATLAVVRPPANGSGTRLSLWVANCGDSRAVLWRPGSGSIAETRDHRPSDAQERARVELAGGVVCEDFDPPRIDGQLACSRALGAFKYKQDSNLKREAQKVSSVPDIYEWAAEPGDWLILACDGVWDTFSSERIVNEVCKAGDSCDIGDTLARTLQLCIDKEADDNLTLMVVKLGAADALGEEVQRCEVSPGNFLKTKDTEALEHYVSFCARFGYTLSKEMVPKKPPSAKLLAAGSAPGPRFANLPPPAPPQAAAAEVALPAASVAAQKASSAFLPPLIVCGPSGAGKGTLIKKLRAAFPGRFGVSVSHTTRAIRPGEVDGVHYYFVDRDAMQKRVDAGDFVEHAEVHGHLYATSKQAVETVQENGLICIIEIDIQGVKKLKESGSWKDAIFLFIAPPSLELLEQRLRGRGTETEERIATRLTNAKIEMEYGSEDDAFHIRVVNGDLATAERQLERAVRKCFPAFAPELRVTAKRPARVYILAAKASLAAPEAPRELCILGAGEAAGVAAEVACSLKRDGCVVVDVSTGLTKGDETRARAPWICVVVRRASAHG